MKRFSRILKWQIAKLKEHPRQRELFRTLPAHELAAMAGDMAKNGLSHPIEILRDGTISRVVGVDGAEAMVSLAKARLGYRSCQVDFRVGDVRCLERLGVCSEVFDVVYSSYGSSRVLRGGYWHFDSSSCRSAYRYPYTPASHSHHHGFRVVVGR